MGYAHAQLYSDISNYLKQDKGYPFSRFIAAFDIEDKLMNTWIYQNNVMQLASNEIRDINGEIHQEIEYEGRYKLQVEYSILIPYPAWNLLPEKYKPSK